jgi:hypothetical protein
MQQMMHFTVFERLESEKVAELAREIRHTFLDYQFCSLNFT